MSGKYRDPLYMQKYNKKFGRLTRLKHRYGITEREWSKLFRAQRKRCAICRTKQAQWVTDHKSGTRHVRGVLCRQCNTGLGMFRDNPSLLRAAAVYIEIGDHT